jgi:aarF domain-containing kinase
MGDGRVQKPFIRKQLTIDLLSNRFILKVFEIAFELPLSWSAESLDRHLREEVDFIKEAHNTERAMADFKADAGLSQRVYVPRVYWDFTTPRVLTSEWITGVELTKRDALMASGFSFTEIMRTVVDAFSYQIFESGFVHGTALYVSIM